MINYDFLKVSLLYRFRFTPKRSILSSKPQQLALGVYFRAHRAVQVLV